MHSEPNHLYLDRAALKDLSELLREIPGLTADLDDAVACRTRLTDPANRVSPRSNDQPLPFNPKAAAVRDHLHATLVAWVRLVCEQRAVDYSGNPSTAGLSRWLDRNLIALAMTEGVDAAPADLRSAVDAAARIICPPAVEIVIDASQIEAARRVRLNISGIALLAKELGEPFNTVTPRRIQTLRDAGRLGSVPGPWSPDWPEQFIVGEVFDAHLAYPMRKRKSKSDSHETRQPLLRIQERRAG